MFSDKHQPQDQGPHDKIEINFFGTKIEVSRRDYDIAVRIAALEQDSVMFHDILVAANKLNSVYLPISFRNALAKSILYTAGDTPQMQNYLFDLEDGVLFQNLDELGRITRLTLVESDSNSAIARYPNIPLSIGELRKNLEFMISAAIRHAPPKNSELKDFLGRNVLAGTRHAFLRFLSTYFEMQVED